MNKVKTSFFCQNCGTQHAKWQGQCNSCKEWNTLSEEVIEKSTKKVWKSSQKICEAIKPLKIDKIDIKQELRINTGDQELDRVLGGGIIPGALILLGGEP
jgi:DNA repair protein RadA/Sms